MATQVAISQEDLAALVTMVDIFQVVLVAPADLVGIFQEVQVAIQVVHLPVVLIHHLEGDPLLDTPCWGARTYRAYAQNVPYETRPFSVPQAE